MHSSCFGVVTCVCAIFQPPVALPSGLKLEAKVIEAMEGGPFVIKATLTNRGKAPVEIEELSHKRPNTSFDISNRDKIPAEIGQPTLSLPGTSVNIGKGRRVVVPANQIWVKGWKFRPVIPAYERILIGPRGNIGVTLLPGESRTELIFIHHRIIDLPARKVTVKISWDVGSAKDAKGLPLASPSLELPVDILPATSENIASVRKRLETRVRAEEVKPQGQEPLAYMLLYTKHRQLVPVACQMLASRNSNNPVRSLIEFIRENSEPAEANRLFVGLIGKMSCERNRRIVFGYWHNHPVELPKEELRKLQDSRDLWIRVMAYSCFHKQYTPAQVENLLAQVREQTLPLPAKKLRGLLSLLDDDDFEVRERASAEMLDLGPRIETQLGRIRKDDLSPEVHTRVRTISKRLKARRSSSPAACTVETFLNPDSTADRGVLLALSQGDPDCWLLLEAKKTLSRSKKEHATSP